MPRHPRAQAIAPLFAGIAALGLAAPASALLINDVPDDRVLACQADPGLQGCSTVLTGIYVCENAAEMEGCAEVLQRLAVLNGDVEPEDEAMTQAELETAVEPRAEGELAEDLDEDDLTPAELAQQDDDEEREGDAGLVAGGSEGGSADGGSGQGAPDGLASNGALPSTHDAPAGTAEATEQQAPGLADEPEETIAPQTPERAAEPGSAPAAATEPAPANDAAAPAGSTAAPAQDAAATAGSIAPATSTEASQRPTSQVQGAGNQAAQTQGTGATDAQTGTTSRRLVPQVTR